MDRTKELWKCLNQRGIYTIEELEKEIQKMKPIDISLMVGKYNPVSQNMMQRERKAV